jgi:hypothetical protein
MADFPDLNDDGKITRADVLKGRGVFKRGGKVKKMRKLDMGGEVAKEDFSGLDYLKKMASRPKRESQLDELRSDLKSTGRAGMSAAKETVGAIPQVREAKELASRVKIPKSYDQEMGMKKGGKVSSASKRADGCAVRGKTRI